MPAMLLGPHAPPQSTLTCNRACLPTAKPAIKQRNSHHTKTRKPRSTGLSAFPTAFVLQPVKTWHAPCNSPFSDSIHYPVSGTLVQAGRGFPSLHRAHTAIATSPTLLGPLIQAGQGFLLYTGLTMQRASPAVLGTLVQAGRGFPLLLLTEMDLHSPAVIDLATGPFAL